jgi:precorrin-4 C11-methyltransferase
MIHFVGAGPGAPDLITLRGAALLATADLVIHAGSLVNPQLLAHAPNHCEVHDSASMTLEEIVALMLRAHESGKTLVRLHTGDPSLYGATGEQMEALERAGIPYDVTPGVSSFLGAAASLKKEYTVPGGSQTVILCRMAGKTPVPEKEDIEALAAHGATMVIFLSAALLPDLAGKLERGGYGHDTPAAIVYRATWEDEKIVYTRVGRLGEDAARHGIHKTALVAVGPFLDRQTARSLLYDGSFTHEFRKRAEV